MGASPWEHTIVWQEDPTAALHELQARFLAENYDLPSVLREFCDSSRQAVEAVKTEGDEYGLLDIYQADLEAAEEMLSQPLPSERQEQIAMLRRLYESGGEGIGNVLDVTEVSD